MDAQTFTVTVEASGEVTRAGQQPEAEESLVEEELTDG